MHRDVQLRLSLILALALLSACSSQTTPTLPGGTTPQAATLTRADTLTPTTPAAGSSVVMGFTEEGLPFRGNPNARVTLYEHSEFQ